MCLFTAVFLVPKALPTNKYSTNKLNLSSLSWGISRFSYSLPGYCTSVLPQRAAFTHIKELLIALYCNLSTRLPANLLIPQREGIFLLLANVIWSVGLCLAQSKCLVSFE